MQNGPQDRLMRAPRDRDSERAAHRDAGAHDFARAFDFMHGEPSRGVAVESVPVVNGSGVRRVWPGAHRHHYAQEAVVASPLASGL